MQSSLDIGWRRYQRDAARVFRAMGFTASVDASVRGARSTHMVDVWVRGSINGLPWSCVVECKKWKRKIGKAQILALKAICDDIGASAGIVLAESGFQRGAKTAADSTVVRLATLQEIMAESDVRLPHAGNSWNELATFAEERLGPLATLGELPASRRNSLSMDDARHLQRLVITAAEESERELRARLAEGRRFTLTMDSGRGSDEATQVILTEPIEMTSGVDDEGEFTHASIRSGFLELLNNLAKWRREVVAEDILLVPLGVRSKDDTYPDGLREHTWVDLRWVAEIVRRGT